MTPDTSSLHASASLYVVATPLGNLKDITLRALEVLAGVDVIAAEDTRHSRRLLDAHGIQTRLVALHKHNEQSAAAQIIRMLEQGEQVALISDAGTPGVSDPGTRAVARVREAGYAVVPVPGACAAIAALSVSGFGESGFHFAGFLPARSAARTAALMALRTAQVPWVLYEAPHRIAACLADLATVLEPEREIVIAREMTKMFEQIVRMPLGQVEAWLAEDPNRLRGEFVLVVDASPVQEGLSPEAKRVLALLVAELPLKSAARLAAEITQAPRNALYEHALALKA
jgi:16S rRNA (cytidine1402-2'-O)-methyltransferase